MTNFGEGALFQGVRYDLLCNVCDCQAVQLAVIISVDGNQRATKRILFIVRKAVVEGLGCKAIRVFDPNELQNAFAEAKRLMAEHRVPVVVEVILERVTNISMGTEINAINEFEELAERGVDAPTAIALLD